LTVQVSTVTISAGGSGYTSAPTVVFTGGGGSGAAATAVLTNDTVTSVIMTSGGSGYTSAPDVSFTGGGGTGATAAAIITRLTTLRARSGSTVAAHAANAAVYIISATGALNEGATRMLTYADVCVC
jgi:hypothetical protein